MLANTPFQRLQVKLGKLIAATPAGERLPSEPKLAKQLGVSRATLREAMRTFETQGLIRRRQGAGTFVVGQVPVLESGLEVLESIETLAERIDLDVSASDLDVTQILADEKQAGILDVPLGTPLTRVRRVMQADDRPVAYLIDTLPQGILHPDDLESPQFTGSVLDFLLARGDPALNVARTAVSALGARSDVAKALEIQRGDVLLHFVSQLYAESGRVVDHSSSYFLPGYFHFHVVRRVGY
ncbi:MAG: GntR family transcriptional regulator [Chloroflexi bacterium]|nr:GntR family transcriptional regulator [Chloroflexota bacterium]